MDVKLEPIGTNLWNSTYLQGLSIQLERLSPEQRADVEGLINEFPRVV